MTNEILLCKNIDLKKYLITINLSKYDKKRVDYVESYYSNITVKYPKPE